MDAGALGVRLFKPVYLFASISSSLWHCAESSQNRSSSLRGQTLATSRTVGVSSCVENDASW